MAASELPEGRYLTCPIDVAVDTGGQTRALLMRNRIFARHAGISPSILTFGPAVDMEQRRETLLERGLLLPEIELLNIYDSYATEDWSDSEPTGEELPDLSAFLKSEETRPDGAPWRRTYRPPDAAPRVVHDYLRPDGTTYLRTPSWIFKDAETWPKRLVRVARTGEVMGSYPSLNSWYREWIRSLSKGHERSFVFIDSRFIAPLIAPMKAPNIHLIYLLHNIHVSDDRRWDSPTNDVYARLLDLVGDFDAFVTLTDRQRQDIAQRCGRTSNMFVVPNPVDMPPPPDPLPERDPRLVSVVARIEGQKRLSHAVEAFKHVVAAIPDARLEIWGTGSRVDGIRSAIERRGLQGSVSMMGHHPQAREALWKSSAMLMTSLFEGYPLSTLESLSHGCPVISYDIKYGPREQVTDGVDGFLVPEGDTRTLADRIVTLLQDPDRVRTMSAAALEKARAHGVDRFISDWAAVVRSAAELKPSRTRIHDVHLTVQRLGVHRPGPGRLRLLAGPAAVAVGSRLSLRATLDVRASARESDLSQARVELAAVHEGSGEVAEVPVKVKRSGDQLRVRADVPLADLYPPRPADDDGPEAARGPAYLRLRLVWQNSCWQTAVPRPADRGDGAVVELSYLQDGRLQLVRR